MFNRGNTVFGKTTLTNAKQPIATATQTVLNRALYRPTTSSSKATTITYMPTLFVSATSSNSTTKPMRNPGRTILASWESTSSRYMTNHATNAIVNVVSFTIDANIIGNTGKKQNAAVIPDSGPRANPRPRRYASNALTATHARNACNADNRNTPTS